MNEEIYFLLSFLKQSDFGNLQLNELYWHVSLFLKQEDFVNRFPLETLLGFCLFYFVFFSSRTLAQENIKTL